MAPRDSTLQNSSTARKTRRRKKTPPQRTNVKKEDGNGDHNESGSRRSKRTKRPLIKYSYSDNSDGREEEDEDGGKASSDFEEYVDSQGDSVGCDDNPEDVLSSSNMGILLEEKSKSRKQLGAKVTNNNNKKTKKNVSKESESEKPAKRLKRDKRASPTNWKGNSSFKCLHCGKEFKTPNGLQYHVKNFVCRRPKEVGWRDIDALALPTLDPGERFVTAFGLVEVVKDDRAVPTAIYPENIQAQHRKYQKSKTSEDDRITRRYIKIAGKLRVRRNAINALYEKGKVNRRSVFEAYFGGDAEHIRSVIKAESAVNGGARHSFYRCNSNPKEPEGSFPNRIVECISITDHRSHVLDLGKNIAKRDAKQQPMKLYLQRKLLNQPYVELDQVYYCPDCGRKFHNPQSQKWHCTQNKCIQEARTKKKKREDIQMRIENHMKKIVQFPEKRKFVRNIAAPQVEETIKPSKWWRKKKKLQPSIYPELVLGMGFKFVAKRKIDVNNMPLKFAFTAPILDGLKLDFEIQQRKRKDQMHGSIYAEIYKALGFKHPRKRKGTSVGNNVGKRKRRRREAKPKPPPPPKPLPPAIDVVALIDEVKSGRYPSIKKFQGEHADLCALCKKGGEMFCCEYCNNVEHFQCILSRFTIKMPELDEDFMCHKCIGVILARRARAEKRRLRKQIKHEQLKKEEEQAQNDASDGNEYPYMASQAREVNELVELLKDSQVRLRRSIETTKLNNIRRKVIAGVYPDMYSKPY